jgi:protein-disulfide isomerase/uncharacterized membrane protein
LHADAFDGKASFCNFSETVSCDRVALSRFSVLVGLPVTAWGVLGYALVAGLALSGLIRRRPGSTWPAGFLLVLGAATTLASVLLAAVSKVAIGAWCPLCVVSWVTSVGLLALAWRACRAAGVARAIADDLAALRSKSFRTGAAGVLLAGGVLLAVVAYPRYWERPAAPFPIARAEAVVPRIASDGRPLVVSEYADYECPSCARMHEVTRELTGRTDIRLVRRHFPLDPACNPAVNRQVHPSACALARAGVCAEAQGRFAEMDDALFANQRDRAPTEALAARVGLDLARFRACLTSPETDARIAADVAAAVRDGVRATPSYVLDGVVYTGKLPPELLGARTAAAPASSVSFTPWR